MPLNERKKIGERKMRNGLPTPSVTFIRRRTRNFSNEKLEFPIQVMSVLR